MTVDSSVAKYAHEEQAKAIFRSIQMSIFSVELKDCFICESSVTDFCV